jgi:hypothetical protein
VCSKAGAFCDTYLAHLNDINDRHLLYYTLYSCFTYINDRHLLYYTLYSCFTYINDRNARVSRRTSRCLSPLAFLVRVIRFTCAE